jgi:hypothetical protein
MGIKPRATGIAIGVLLVAALVQPAKADTYQATGHTDSVACAQPGPPLTCSDISYSLDFTTSGLVGPDKAVKNFYLLISGITGEINGVPVSCVPGTAPPYPCGDLLASRSNYPGPPIPDGTIILVGSGGIFAFLSAGPDSTVPFPTPYPIVKIGIGNARAYATWNIVSTPEPSTLLFLGIGLLGLMGLTLLKTRFS